MLPILTGCRPDTVLLAYRYPDSATISYTMNARARASWDIGETGPQHGSYIVQYVVTESVVEADAEEAVVRVEMDPISISANRLPPPDSAVRSFTLRLGSRGELLEILEVDDVPARELEPSDIAFIGTYRPPLPLGPVRLADEWQSQQEFHLESIFQQLLVIGQLRGLNRDAAGSYAKVEYRGSGPLVWTIELPGGDATLTGDGTTDATAVVDLDDGSLRQATSNTHGDFDVRVLPKDDVSSPLTGALSLDISIRLIRMSSGEAGQPASSAPTTT